VHLAVCAILLTCAPHARALDEDQTGPRVRVLDDKVQILYEQLIRQSPTFRGLLDDLQRSDLIVYVKLQVPRIAEADGMLQMAATVERHRYLRATIRPGLVPRSIIAILAHELQHARELAAAPTVRDAAAMANHFAHIGTNIVADVYETEAARTISLKVLREFDDGQARTAAAESSTVR
jgi:hypothetical protein